MKKINLKPILVLCSICLAVALMLSLINSITAPIIEANQAAAANEALLEVLPNGKNFTALTIDDTYPAPITMGYRADGGYVFTATVTGKSSGLVIMCGIDESGRIVSTKVLADQETDSYDEKVFPLVEGTSGKYVGMELSTFEPFLVSGATLTSRAYSEAIKAILQAFVIANGGEVDIRTPEQVLQDNCNTALGTTALTYTKWFAAAVLEGITAVYEAPDAQGFVYVVGDRFVGVNASGTIVTADVDTTVAATVNAAHALLSATELTEVTERPEGIHKWITKIFKTESGSYVFEVNADGFSVDNEWGSNTPIVIRVSISADGKIIDCRTLSHDESKGYGDKCATEEYYEDWRGTTIDGVEQNGIISGATVTTGGYQKAIKRAFEAFAILTGGADNE